MKVNLKDLFEQYNSLPKSPERTKLGKKIRKEEKKLVDELDYVEIIYILQFLGDYDKDALLLDLINKHPESSLFVLSLTKNGMHSYTPARKIAMHEYENNEEAIDRDSRLIFDKKLCAFLSKYNSKQDCAYVRTLTDGASWLESNRKSLRGLI